MSEMVRITVAPGSVVTIAHPSGLQGLPSLNLFAGEQLSVSAARAERLYRDGMILHPTTGQPPRPSPQMRTGLQITGDQTSWKDMARLADEVSPGPRQATKLPSEFSYQRASPFREPFEQSGPEISDPAASLVQTSAERHQRQSALMILDQNMRDRRPLGHATGGHLDVEPRDQLHRNGI